MTLYQVYFWHPSVKPEDFPEVKRVPSTDPRVADHGEVALAPEQIGAFLARHSDYWIAFRGDQINVDTRMFNQR